MILLLGSVLALLAWSTLRRSWLLDVERQTQTYASTLASAVEAEIQGLDALLRRRAQLWAGDAFRRDTAAWRDDVGMLLVEHPALLAERF